MSRALLRSVIYCQSSNILASNYLNSRGFFSIFKCSSKSSKLDELGQAFILIEDGSSIRELPVIVRKVSSNSFLFCENKVQSDLCNSVTSDSTSNSNGGNKKEKFNDSECKEIIEYYNKCYSARGIFAILETIPASEVTPYVALQALKRIVTLENNKAIRNAPLNVFFNAELDNNEEGLHENETFTRTAVLTQLVDKILTSSDADILLNGFLMVNRDIIGKYIDQDNKNRFTNEILCRVTDGKFSIVQTCEAIKIFSDIASKPDENIDKLWVGITEKINDINKDNFMDVVRSIQYLNRSRKVVLSVVEKKLIDFWYKINGHDVAEILVVLKQIKSNSPRILSVLSQWVNKNIHTASEDDLIEIINGFCSLDYNNSGIEQALERYVKVKGVSIRNPTLMANIMDYCLKFRVRSPILLQGSAEYIIVHGNSLSPVLLQKLFLPLGKLNYGPLNGANFWKVLEKGLEDKFVQFRPEEAITMLLNCIYLKKYPLNFINKVFNPYFLDRLHSYKNQETVVLSRAKLQVLDIAMTLECSQYQGPVLPKLVNSPPIWVDGRVKRMTNYIRSTLEEISGGCNKVIFNLVPVKLPSIDIYMIEALILNKDLTLSVWPRFINFDRDHNMHTAVLIHPPEHYCSQGVYLTGEQEMRKRHFRHLGLKVASLDVTELAKLRVHPRALKKYIEEKLLKADPPFPKVKTN